MPPLPSITETAVMDPLVFAPLRKALALDELGLAIRDVDWGESDVELFLIRQELGEIPADRHPPNQIITMKLMVMEEGVMSLADAAGRLQQKVGTWQDEGGFIERVLNEAGQFKSSVAYKVYKAALAGLQGWMFAHRNKAPDVTLTMMRSPYCYGPPRTLAKTVTVGQREMVLEETGLAGSAPGLLAASLKNEDTGNWNGLIGAIECKDFTSGIHASLAFDAEALTPEGSSEVVFKGGTKSGNAVKRVLSRNWQVILSSAEGGVDMTHKGIRRFLIRFYDESKSPGQTRFMLEWRKVGSSVWVPNPEQASEASEAYTYADLGEVRLDETPVGEQLWEWRIVARTTGTSTVYLDRLYVFPTEQYFKLALTTTISPPSSFEVEDGFNQIAGNLNGKKEEAAAREWVTEGAAGDFQTGGGVLQRSTAVSAPARTAHIKGLEPEDAIVQCELEFNPIATSGAGITMGVNCRSGGAFASIRVVLSTGGYSSFINTPAGTTSISNLAPDTAYLLTMMVLGNSQFTWLTLPGQILGDPQFVVRIPEKTGTLGLEDFGSALEPINRKYRNFLVWEPEGGAAVFAGRSIAIRSEGLFRQHQTKNAYGEITPRGRLPYVPPARLEKRTMRAIFLPSKGNFGTLSDSGSHNMTLEFTYFPGYHFASEGL